MLIILYPKTLKIFILFFLLFTFNISGQKTKYDILGKWMATDKSVAVQVYLIRNSFKAKVIWFDERLGSGTPMNTRADTQNPDPKLRNGKVIGMDILAGLDYNFKNQRWENGKIYDASSGKTWDAYAEITEQGQMYVRGYWKWKCFGKTLYFNRIKEK